MEKVVIVDAIRTPMGRSKGGAFRWLDTLGSAKYLDMAQQYQHLGPLYEVPEGLRNKARHNEPYYPPVEPARPVGDLKTA